MKPEETNRSPGPDRSPDPERDPAAIEAAIEAYRPLGAPEAVRDEVTGFARQIVRAAGPISRGRAKRTLSQVSRFSTWALHAGLPLEDELFQQDTIERFVSTITSEAGARTSRGELRWIARRVAPHLQTPDPLPLARHPVSPWYTEDELTDYLAAARMQSTRLRRMRATAIICLGAGAGLGSREIRQLRGTDIHRRGHAVTVEVSGPHARVVPVLDRFTEPVMKVANWARDGLIFDPPTSNRIRCTLDVLERNSELPRLEPRRLRNTWLATHLRRMGFTEFLVAAGITRSQTLFDLNKREPQPTAEQVIETLTRDQQW